MTMTIPVPSSKIKLKRLRKTVEFYEKLIKHLKSEKELSEFEHIMKTSKQYEQKIKKLEKDVEKLKKDVKFEVALADKVANDLIKENEQLKQKLKDQPEKIAKVVDDYIHKDMTFARACEVHKISRVLILPISGVIQDLIKNKDKRSG